MIGRIARWRIWWWYWRLYDTPNVRYSEVPSHGWDGRGK